MLEIKCPDRLGLLYQITGTLAALGLDIVSARIATEIDQALDTFYVQDRKGDKIDAGGGARAHRSRARARAAGVAMLSRYRDDVRAWSDPVGGGLSFACACGPITSR